MTLPLKGIWVVSLATNVPGPVAAAGLRDLGASIVKIEPPSGDPLAEYSSEWYRNLAEGQEVQTLNLKEVEGREKLNVLLGQSDLLLTSMRPEALERLNLNWLQIHERFLNLSQISIVGYDSPRENKSGHDLTYQAMAGLIVPSFLPRTLYADLAAAEKVVSAALTLILARHKGQPAEYRQISIESVVKEFTAPIRYGLTASGGLLEGSFPGYNIYQTAEGWMAVAALEPKFWNKLISQLGLVKSDYEDLQNVFLTRTAVEWESWADAHDIPVSAITC
jgi:crotonobetainyl-CoA:carnitine CoA-transferase CaiB-like acyl-CoA transferase